MNQMLKLVSTAALGLSFAGTAYATTLCVQAATPGCYPLVTAALTAAASGDVIEVAAGTYAERIVIPPALANVTIRGASRDDVVIDPGEPLSGVGITIAASGVTIERFTLLGSDDIGIQVEGGGAGTRIDSVALRGPFGATGIAVEAGADGVVVVDSEVRSTGGPCVDAEGDGFTLQDSLVRHCGSGGVEIYADDATVIGNDIGASEDQPCVFVESDRANVSENTVAGCTNDGVLVFGDSIIVVDNRVESAQGDVMDVSCADCTDVEVSDNYVAGCPEASYALAVDAGTAGATVAGNIVERVGVDGILIQGVDVVVSKNRVKNSSRYRDAAAMNFEGTGHVISGNRVGEQGGDGMRIEGGGLSLSGNQSRDNAGDGFDVLGAAVGITLDGNRSSNNGAEGYDVSLGALSTVLLDNDSDDDRLDFCDEGTMTTDGGGNSFTLPGGACELD